MDTHANLFGRSVASEYSYSLLSKIERLLTTRPRSLFNEQRRSHAVLYVGHDNSAASVYDKVGFVGLDGTGRDSTEIESWKEIGFDRSKVDLGHW